MPILGDIPLLGLLFRHSVDTKAKTELLIFLTPLVAQVPDTMQGICEGELSRTRNVYRAVQPGAFQEQLNGMKGAAPPAGTPKQLAPGIQEPSPSRTRRPQPRCRRSFRRRRADP